MPFADQSKAFDRLHHKWVEAVPRARRIPERWITLLLAFITPRWARGAGAEAAALLLVCGAGMGGPIKPLLWALGFDPIVVDMQLFAQCRSPPA